MAFLRADTARTMLSRTNSTGELSLGVCQVLYDANGQLPDNLEDLEAMEKELADLEAKQSQAESLERLQLQSIASPQHDSLGALGDTLPATDTQVAESLGKSPTYASSDGGSKGVVSPTSPVPSSASNGDDAVRARVHELLASGQIDDSMAAMLFGEGGRPTAGGQKRPIAEVTPTVVPTSIDDSPVDDAELDDFIESAKKAKSDNAALKARLRRLCEPKKNGRLQVPQWLHDMWKSGDHLKLAQEFQSCNFNKDRFIQYKTKTMTKSETKANVISSGWYTKEDMVKILKWPAKKINGAIKLCEQDPEKLIRRCQYGGEDEYRVNVRETGTNEQQQKASEETTEQTQGSDGPKLADVKLGRVDADAVRDDAARSAQCAATSEALRSQDLFAKHTESVLTKTSKIRSLIADLQKNYNQDSTAMKAVETLNNDLKVLASEYNKLSEHLAKGERDDHSKEWSAESEKILKLSTFTCTKVAATEAKIRSAKRHFKKVVVKDEDK